jgi:poly-gamma-glutamate synthesis protein (capsule biosynthesis protein)
MRQDDSSAIEIIVTGDFCPIGRIEDMCKADNYGGIYGNLLPLLLDKDISITNLECPLTDVSRPIVKSGPSLRADKKCAAAIKYGGIDIAALANNHSMDQGPVGLDHTISACNEAGIQIVGAGMNLEAAGKPLYIKVKGKTVAFLNFAEFEFSIATQDGAGANPLDPVDNYNQIQEAKNNADVVLVILHGGNEYYHLPNPRMVKTCRFFADLGVAAVVCHHTHCASGYEVHNGVPIIYSLGNFVFDWEKHRSDDWYEGYFVKLKIYRNRPVDFSIHPYTQCKNGAYLDLMEGVEYSRFMDKLKKYSEIILDAGALEKNWLEFCRSRSMDYMPLLLSFGKVGRKLFKNGLYKGTRTRREHLLRLLNLFRCQAHKDATTRVLEDWLERKGQ